MILLLGLTIIIIVLVLYLQHMVRSYSYWKKRGVIGPKPYPFVGNYKTVFFKMETEGDFLKKIYERYPNEKFIGIYKGIRPVLVIRDPDIVKQVLIKDFDRFSDKCFEKPLQLLNKSVFVMRGRKRWQELKSTLTPSFTKCKLAKMMPSVQRATDTYLKFVEYLVSIRKDHEIGDLKTKFLMEVIANLVCGEQLDTFSGGNEFQQAINAWIDPRLQSNSIHIVSFVCPPIVKALIPIIRLEYGRRIYNRLRKFIKRLIYKRRNKPRSPTFIETLIDLKNRSKISNGRIMADIDDDEIQQQIMTFILAIYVTNGTLLGFIIHELAANMDIQEKCYKEVMVVFEKYNGQLTLDALLEMKYVEMVIDETLRVHPTSHCIDRKCVSKYTFPNTNVTIDKGTFIFVPLHGLHRDPKYFENPDVFDPDRFLPVNKGRIGSCVYLPFGNGPRMCLGLRLGKMLTVLCLASFLRIYKITPCSKTKPVKYDPSKLLATSPLGGIWVNIEARN